MKLLHDTYLDKMNEELEIINYKLEKLHEAINFDEGDISLLDESFDMADNTQYQVYVESLSDTLKKIWRTIIRFIKSIFVSSGEKITMSEAKKIVDLIDAASKNAEVDKLQKKVLQKAFYMLAGLGSRQSGRELYNAYSNGNILEYITANAEKLKDVNLPDGEFRVCVGAYDEDMDIKSSVIGYMFKKVNDVDIQTESAENGVDFSGMKLIDLIGLIDNNNYSTTDRDRLKKAIQEKLRLLKVKIDQASSIDDVSKCTFILRTMYDGIGSKFNGSVSSKEEFKFGLDKIRTFYDMCKKKVESFSAYRDSISFESSRIHFDLTDDVLSKYLSDKNNIVFSTMVFANENKPDGFAIVRLFSINDTTNTVIKGHDKIQKLRDAMITKIEDIEFDASNVNDLVTKDQISEMSQIILKFFAGMTSTK